MQHILGRLGITATKTVVQNFPDTGVASGNELDVGRDRFRRASLGPIGMRQGRNVLSRQARRLDVAVDERLILLADKGQGSLGPLDRRLQAGKHAPEEHPGVLVAPAEQGLGARQLLEALRGPERIRCRLDFSHHVQVFLHSGRIAASAGGPAAAVVRNEQPRSIGTGTGTGTGTACASSQRMDSGCGSPSSSRFPRDRRRRQGRISVVVGGVHQVSVPDQFLPPPLSLLVPVVLDLSLDGLAQELLHLFSLVPQDAFEHPVPVSPHRFQGHPAPGERSGRRRRRR
mmetsp:Transcript_2228/g.5975  ORF Transcript_2228/g.5975 Transcript_2228/m.5975 type:complete len:286 (-) Transcript_2228:2-859(-)